MIALPESILTDLDSGATVVVPSRQRAVALQLAYAATQLCRHRILWTTPDVIPWDSWLERETARSAETAQPMPRPLRAAEEWLLWRQAVDDALAGTDVSSTGWLIDSLQRSARLLYDWCIPVAALGRAGNGESGLLVRALQGVEARCAELRAIGSHRLAEQLTGRAARQPVTFAGLTERTRAQAALMEQWSAREQELREHRTDVFPGAASTVCAEDETDELARAAAWCRARLAQDPRSRLLVIVPDLGRRRSSIVRLFEQALAPQAILDEQADAASPCYAIEGGQPLGQSSLVRHALGSLRLLCGEVGFTQWSAWLRAAFWSSPLPPERARLEVWLRRVLGTTADACAFAAALEQVPSSLAAIALPLRSAIVAAARALELDAGRATPRQWSRRFGSALEMLGWPGEGGLTSAQHQTRTRFQQVLDEFASLGPSLAALRATDALRIVEELAERTAFEPASGDSPVTISGALIDPIVRYDGIWVTGLHAEAWPQPGRVDPFVPIAAQRQAGVPAASPVRLLEQARAMLRLWQHSTARLVVSWPRRADDRDHLPCPLLAELPGVRRWDDEASAQAPLARQLRSARRTESVEDASGDPWPLSLPLPGGTRSIEHQNHCPFRAYAELRLLCVPLEAPRPGIDARERGRLLHRALELVWSELGGSQGLRAHQGARMEALARSCAQRAAQEIVPDAQSVREHRALQREIKRAARLACELCELERRRPPFRIRALEEERRLAIAGATVDVRIDRIDELEEDATCAIFDYKTGNPQRQEWLGERVSHPQLLVYMLAAPSTVTAMVTVHLTPTQVSYRGIADRLDRLARVEGLAAGNTPQASSAWREQTNRWRTLIERLTADFVAGSALRDPTEHACRTCHLHAFCRIADASPLQEPSAHD